MDFKAALKSFAEAWAVAQIQTLQGTSSSSPFLPPTAEIVSKLSASTSKPPTPAIAPILSVVGQSGSSPPTENLEPEKMDFHVQFPQVGNFSLYYFFYHFIR